MENFPYSSSYPDSGDSSPRSREIDTENQSWDEPPSNYRVKFMCSYGGKIQPRPHDNQLAYINGDTKILAVDRNIKFAAIMAKLSSICGDAADVCFKYQLPGEDLDALISVTNDEDLEHMMLEYDRLHRASAKPARLRLFLFPINPEVVMGFGSNETKSERQWFVDALNSVQIPALEGSSPPTAKAANPDFLFGLDKGFGTDPAAKISDSVAAAVAAATIPEVVAKDASAAGSDCGSEDRAVASADIQRQIQELQRLQIAAGHEQGVLQRKSDEINQRAYNENMNYYGQKGFPEKVVAAGPPQVQVPVQMPIPAAYLPERHMTTAGYQVAAASGNEQPVYLIPAPAGMYPPALRPVTGPAGPAYYGVQRMVPEMYREQPVYNAVPPGSIQQPKVGGYGDGIGMVQPKAAVAEQGYVQVGYDGAGRQVYYTTAAPGGVIPQYQAVALDGRQGGGALNQEGKVVVNAKGPQTSSV